MATLQEIYDQTQQELNSTATQPPAQKTSGKGFLSQIVGSTGIPQTITSGVRAAEGAGGLLAAGVQYLQGNKSAARKTIQMTGREVNKPISMGVFGSYTAPKTAREVIGTGLQAGSTIGFMGAGSVAGATGKAIANRIGTSAVSGALTGGGQSLSSGESNTDILKSALVGGATGAAVAGALEGLGALARKINLAKFGANTYNKELQVPKAEVTKKIESGFKTLGEEIRNVTDDTGKPVYIGNYKTLLEKSREELSLNSKKLSSLAQRYDSAGISATRDEAAGNIINELQDTFGRLNNNQLKQVKFEVSRMPKNMNISEMIKYKRLYDSLIPDSYWLNAGNADAALSSQIKYALRDNLKNLINEKTRDATIAALNKRLGLAMEVKHLSAAQMAQRATQKITGQGGFFYKLVGRSIDDYILNPAITTRASQLTNNLGLGQKTGKTLLRRAGRSLLTNALMSASKKSNE